MSFLHVDKLYKINHVCHTYKLLSLKCKNNILNLNLYYYYYCNNNFMLTSVLYKCFYCIVINSYMCNIFIHTLTPLSLSLKGKKQYLCLSHAHTYTFIHASVRLSVIKHTNTYTRSCHSHTRDGGVTRRLYVRLRVWKILDICSMTGPVSGSFIHWVLFRGFSSMSSNAAHKHKAYLWVIY